MLRIRRLKINRRLTDYAKQCSLPVIKTSDFVGFNLLASSSNIYVRFLANDRDKILHRLVVVVQ